jgi:ABC-type cobalamin/Fe3+-siderophores transport system ATPase subunit
MSQQRKQYDIFKHGSVWLKADFHLHTRADKEFSYDGENDYYASNYVAKLVETDTRVGVITNHNKFDYDEFKQLSKVARKNEILLLPGVELSVNDGANGVHVLIVFSNLWLENGNDYINSAISTMFPGKSKSEYEQENGRSDKNILSVVEELDKVGRDYFMIFAHVEQRSGLWEEMKGGKLSDFSTKRYESVRRRTLGFQKVRTRDERTKVKDWLGGWYPSEVEGSDAKSIDQIGGQKEETWLKLGDYTFEAVKYALADFAHRLRSECQDSFQRSLVKSVRFEGGILDGQQINFSSELNALIGIRGSGKSSLLEAVRYALDIPFADKTIDKSYKESLVAHTLGSGGKVILEAVDKHGQAYSITRRLNDLPEVFVDGQLQPGVAIRETVIHKPIYFGQKDLSSTGEGFEKDLVEKLVGEKLLDTRERVFAQKDKIRVLIQRLLKLGDIAEKMAETRDKKQDAEFRLKVFKENGIDDKLKQQTDFDVDQRKIKKVLSDASSFDEGLSELLDQTEDDLKNHLLYQSKQNSVFFVEFFKLYNSVLGSYDKIRNERIALQLILEQLRNKETEFAQLKQTQLDTFAETRRALETELRQQGKALNIEEFPELQSKIETSKQLLTEFEKESQKSVDVKRDLVTALSELNELWHQEFRLIEAELAKVNEGQASLKIFSVFKGEKDLFLDKFKSAFKGSRIRESSFQSLVNDYSDFSQIYNDWNNAKSKAGGSTEIFEQYFNENLEHLLTWQVPNKFVIEYQGKELQHHSLGQRASALILFVLSQKDNDVVIIDQPEDDLDNQTIYNDVIKLIREIKPEIQFIFATHNANFPVLGDAEQVHACRYSDESMMLKSGSIDCPDIQQEIVDIMEGGEDAFNKRKEIYQIWKPQS